MSYTKVFTPLYENGWKNNPDTTTPVMAEALNGYDDALEHIEDYLAAGGGGGSSDPIFKTLTWENSVSEEGIDFDAGTSCDIQLLVHQPFPDGYVLFNIVKVTLHDRRSSPSTDVECLWSVKNAVPFLAPTVTLKLFNCTDTDEVFTNVGYTAILCKSSAYSSD